MWGNDVTVWLHDRMVKPIGAENEGCEKGVLSQAVFNYMNSQPIYQIVKQRRFRKKRSSTYLV